MAEYTQNGTCTFNIGTQVLKWNTGTANVYTSDPVVDGATLAGLITNETTGAE